MTEERRLIIPGILEKIPEVCDFVAEAAESVGLDERGIYHAQMAVDEWCTNVIEHGFEDDERPGKIEIRLHLQPSRLTISINDDGIPFDPTTLPDVDPTQPLEDRQPGGLGWFFIRKIMDEVSYEFKDGHNYLTMVKTGARPEMETASQGPVSPFPVRTSQGVRIMAPAGRIDSAVGRKLEAALVAQIEAGYNRLVVDMSQVTYISSTGLKALLTALRRTHQSDGEIALAAMTRRVREVFDMSGFATLFIITDTVDAAAPIVLQQKS